MHAANKNKREINCCSVRAFWCIINTVRISNMETLTLWQPNARTNVLVYTWVVYTTTDLVMILTAWCFIFIFFDSIQYIYIAHILKEINIFCWYYCIFVLFQSDQIMELVPVCIERDERKAILWTELWLMNFRIDKTCKRIVHNLSTINVCYALNKFSLIYELKLQFRPFSLLAIACLS